MPICILCSHSFKTRGTLAKHRRLFHDGKSLDDSVPPVRVSLPYFVNLVQQPLKCPLCPFVRERCRNVNSVAAHFRMSHPYHELCVSYNCQWCDSHIYPAEIAIHVRAHALSCTSRIPIPLDALALGNHLPNNAEAKALCFYLLTLATALIWQNRNKKIWQKEYQERDLYEQLMDIIRSRIKKETLINESRMSYMWSYHGILCTYVNGIVDVHI